jgi:hypothetical protein
MFLLTMPALALFDNCTISTVGGRLEDITSSRRCPDREDLGEWDGG